MVFRGLTGSTTYVVLISAVNSVGESPTNSSQPFTTLAPVLPRAPGQPSALAVAGGSVTLAFAPAADLGGSPLVQYLVEASSNLTVFFPVAVVDQTDGGADDAPVQLRVTALSADTLYFFRVSVVTAVGRGPVSPKSLPVRTVEAHVPDPVGQPRALSSRTASTAVASWEMTADDGGVPVRAYTLTVHALSPPDSTFHSFTLTLPVAQLRYDRVRLFSSVCLIGRDSCLCRSVLPSTLCTRLACFSLLLEQHADRTLGGHHRPACIHGVHVSRASLERHWR
jgi:hypothetical protein